MSTVLAIYLLCALIEYVNFLITTRRGGPFGDWRIIVLALVPALVWPARHAYELGKQSSEALEMARETARLRRERLRREREVAGR